MKNKFQYQTKFGRKAYIICFLWVMIGLSGLFGCSKTEEYVVAVDTADVADVTHDEEGTDITYDTDSGASQSTLIYVDVCGAVRYPGVYRLNDGARVFEALELAGGTTEEACIKAVNQAEFLTDGQKLYIPIEAEWEYEFADSASETENDGRININTASQAELCTLPGIGLTRAQAIIAYREANGAFESVEAVQNVSGIKSATYEKIKALIKIR